MGASNTAGNNICARLLLMVLLQAFPKIPSISVPHQHAYERKENAHNVFIKQHNKSGKQGKYRPQHKDVLDSSLAFVGSQPRLALLF